MNQQIDRLESRDRSGVALIVVLGFLSIMVMMAVAFLTQARVERMVANISADAHRGRQMARTALNAAMRGVVKCLLNSGEEVEIYGFLEGYRGLIYGDFRMLQGSDFSGILTKGGTILGSSRTPFKTIQDPDENGLNKVEAMKHNFYKLNLDCLVILGGNGNVFIYFLINN